MFCIIQSIRLYSIFICNNISKPKDIRFKPSSRHSPSPPRTPSEVGGNSVYDWIGFNIRLNRIQYTTEWHSVYDWIGFSIGVKIIHLPFRFGSAVCKAWFCKHFPPTKPRPEQALAKNSLWKLRNTKWDYAWFADENAAKIFLILRDSWRIKKNLSFSAASNHSLQRLSIGKQPAIRLYHPLL